MTTLSIDLTKLLSQIREHTVKLCHESWNELGLMMNSTLPDPLGPMVLLPIASGFAVRGQYPYLVRIASCVLLISTALEIIDDCADLDKSDALLETIGIGPSVNFAFALNTIATRELYSISQKNPQFASLIGEYFQAFLMVAQGQNDDMKLGVTTLYEYEAVVRNKTVAAYEFAMTSGALISNADPKEFQQIQQCGRHLGWMIQILNDIEGLWFPNRNDVVEMRTFPVFYGASLDHENAERLREIIFNKKVSRKEVCGLLDGMDIRMRLLSLALNHRDKAIELLGGKFNPEGQAILSIWLDWVLRDGERLLGAKPE